MNTLYVYIYIYIYIYILVEYFVLNIYTKWMLLTEKIYWLIIKKQIEKNIDCFSKKGLLPIF